MTKDTLLAEAADALDAYAQTIYVNENAEPSPFDFIVDAFKAKRHKYLDLARQLRAREDAGKADALEAARLAPKRVGVIARHTGSMLDMAILKWDEWQPPEGAVLFVVNYGTEGEPLYFPPPDAALSTKPEAGEGEGR